MGGNLLLGATVAYDIYGVAVGEKSVGDLAKTAGIGVLTYLSPPAGGLGQAIQDRGQLESERRETMGRMYMISIFNGEALKTADVYKGYMPPKYGERLSGVAALQMRDVNRKSHHQSFTDWNPHRHRSGGRALIKNRGSSLVSAREFVPGWFLQGYYTESKYGCHANGTGVLDVTAKLSYELNKSNSLYASFYTGYDNFNVAQWI